MLSTVSSLHTKNGERMPRVRSRQKPARLGLFAAGLMILAAPPASAATAQLGPRDIVQHLYSELLDVMHHAAVMGVRGRYQKLEPLIFGTFDVPFMAKLTIGPTWLGLPPEQKYRAAQAYGRYITAVYASRFDGYSGEKLEVLHTEDPTRHAGQIADRQIRWRPGDAGFTTTASAGRSATSTRQGRSANWQRNAPNLLAPCARAGSRG
jgi:hypothetical protein